VAKTPQFSSVHYAESNNSKTFSTAPEATNMVEKNVKTTKSVFRRPACRSDLDRCENLLVRMAFEPDLMKSNINFERARTLVSDNK